MIKLLLELHLLLLELHLLLLLLLKLVLLLHCRNIHVHLWVLLEDLFPPTPSMHNGHEKATQIMTGLETWSSIL